MAAIEEQPTLQLNFYSYGIVLRKKTAQNAYTEYAVDPAQITQALAVRNPLETGLLTANTLFIRTDGITRTVVEYRPPQITGIFIEGTENAVRVPLPGMVMIRRVTGKNPYYAIFAVKNRPASLSEKLYTPPLPNMSRGGSVCWGSVKKVPKKALETTSLDEDWKLYLGSQFNSHGVGGKSKKFEHDVRKMLIWVEQQHLEEWPHGDLVQDGTLESALRGGAS